MRIERTRPRPARALDTGVATPEPARARVVRDYAYPRTPIFQPPPTRSATPPPEKNRGWVHQSIEVVRGPAPNAGFGPAGMVEAVLGVRRHVVYLCITKTLIHGRYTARIVKKNAELRMLCVSMYLFPAPSPYARTRARVHGSPLGWI